MNASNRTELHRLSNSHLDALEEETIFIVREVAAAFERPALLFSGGKDSLVMLKCAEKAFGVGRLPYPLLMIDTGHNFPEVTDFRDLRAQELQAQLIVRSVEDSMKRGTVRLAHPEESRNVLQSVTLLEAIEEFRSGPTPISNSCLKPVATPCSCTCCVCPRWCLPSTSSTRWTMRVLLLCT